MIDTSRCIRPHSIFKMLWNESIQAVKSSDVICYFVKQFWMIDTSSC
ncbi:hypothetical protein ACHAXM_002435, partial [Skeletonema potamos]